MHTDGELHHACERLVKEAKEDTQTESFTTLVNWKSQYCKNGNLRASQVAQWLKKIKNLPSSVGDSGLTPGSGRSPGVRNGNPLQYSCLEKFPGQRELVG